MFTTVPQTMDSNSLDMGRLVANTQQFNAGSYLQGQSPPLSRVSHKKTIMYNVYTIFIGKFNAV